MCSFCLTHNSLTSNETSSLSSQVNASRSLTLIMFSKYLACSEFSTLNCKIQIHIQVQNLIFTALIYLQDHWFVNIAFKQVLMIL